MHSSINACFTLTAVKSSVSNLTHRIPSQDRGSVTAVTTLGDDVFVLRYDREQVEVYDAVTFTLQRHITVRGLGSESQAFGMIACARNKCLYISYAIEEEASVEQLSDSDSNAVEQASGGNAVLVEHGYIVKVELPGGNAMKKWEVKTDSKTDSKNRGVGLTGLSVNIAGNLVVACCAANVVQEYGTDGDRKKEIPVTRPWHAIQLSTGNYAVCHSTPIGEVSVVVPDGQVIHSCKHSDVGPMRYPTGLAVTMNDDIIVADEDNFRVLSITFKRSTDDIQEGRPTDRVGGTSTVHVKQLALLVGEGDGCHLPIAVCLDESRDRLYVGEWNGQDRVLVFDRFTAISGL